MKLNLFPEKVTSKPTHYPATGTRKNGNPEDVWDECKTCNQCKVDYITPRAPLIPIVVPDELITLRLEHH